MCRQSWESFGTDEREPAKKNEVSLRGCREPPTKMRTGAVDMDYLDVAMVVQSILCKDLVLRQCSVKFSVRVDVRQIFMSMLYFDAQLCVANLTKVQQKQIACP